MTQEQAKKTEKYYFEKKIKELEERGVKISNPDEILENNDLLIRFLKVEFFYCNDEEFQKEINMDLEELNNYVRIMDIEEVPEVSFSVEGRFETFPAILTGEEFISKANESREISRKIDSEFRNIQVDIRRKYLSFAFDKAINEARAAGAKAVMFKKPHWNRFYYQENQQKFELILEQIKNGTYEGEDMGSYVCGCIADMLLVIIKEDMSKSKSNFEREGVTLITGGVELQYELVK